MIKKRLHLNSHFITLTASLLFSLTIVSCGNKDSAAPVPATPQQQKVIAEAPKPVQKQVTSALRLPPPAVNQFDFSNRKDPFKPFVVVKQEPKGSKEPDKNTLHNSLPIHSFDVSQFKLIGIITGGHENKAMVTDPGGKGYVLKVGMLIGKNDGKITSISSTGVDVLEQFKDDNGRVRKENIKLTLPRKQ